MLKITHFGKFYAPDKGGVESVTKSLAEGAAKKGHVVTVVSFSKKPNKKKIENKLVNLISAPVLLTLASQPISIKYIYYCILFSRSSDVIHLHAPNMLAVLSSLLMPAKVRLLVHWHSDVINKGLLSILFRPLEHALLRRANIVIATSEVYANSSVVLSGYKEKIEVVPIGVADINQSAIDVTLSESIERKIGHKKIVLAVGRLVPYKGLDILVEASRLLNEELIVVIVGEGPMRSSIVDLIKKYSLEDKVILTGRLNDDELSALFKRAYIYCLPSIDRAEAFGVVLLEAMANGLPIVASDIIGSGVPWVNKNGVSGINVIVGDAKILAEACNRISLSSELHLSLSRGARSRYLAEFSEDVTVERMLKIYEGLGGN